MKRFLILIVALAFAATAFADEVWLGIYLQGQKIGYSHYATLESVSAKEGKRSETLTVLDSKMLGSALNVRLQSTTVMDLAGRPLTMSFVTESGGRTQRIDATFGKDTVKVILDNGGAKTSKTIAIPTGALIIDDPTSALLSGTPPLMGKRVEFYILDPTTVSLVKNAATYIGKRKVEVGGQSFDADLIEIEDPRATTKVFMSSKGELIKMEGPFGMFMIPVLKEEALNTLAATIDAPTDIALATALKVEGVIDQPWETSFLKLAVSGVDLKRMPSGPSQSVIKDGDGWIVTVHPKRGDNKATIVAAAKTQPAWLKPGLHIPSQTATFKKLAKQIVGTETRVLAGAKRVKGYVYKLMRPNAGIGVLRDASEVLKTKEGVCRDYAVLTATLARAAGIPAKIASGLVYSEGSFFYHAWVEVWDGAHWIGVDSTRPEDRFSATHLTIAKGSVEDAFKFFVFDGAKLKVLEVRN